MKLSKYIIFHEEGKRKYIYHQISNALLDVDDELYTALLSGETEMLPDNVVLSLKRNGFLVENAIDETCSIRYANLVSRYNSGMLRVTILPTLNCNFKCWYCYEQHKPSYMTDADMKSVVKFIKSEVEDKHLNTVLLDWFGGEPLLRFSQVIYPLSKEVKSWCEEHNVNFRNIITTNGSLINEEMACKMNEIKLWQAQITLDGDHEHHNLVKFSASMNDSYDIIVHNIHTLCKTADHPNIELRINYTNKNIDSAFLIFDDFDESIRKYITVSPHIVWQEVSNMNILSEKASRLCDEAVKKGYNVRGLLRRCATCYTENMEQFVINYDMNVYKCTARDFNKKYCIGRIDENGTFLANDLSYRYYTTPSPFFRKECMDCDLLPSCLYSISCIQKKIEGRQPECDKESLAKFVHNGIANKLKNIHNT